MRKISASLLISALAFSGGLTVLPASPAFAQSGSRLCGYTAITPTGALGLLYEAKQEEVSWTVQCDNAVSLIWTKIQNDPQLRQLTWTKQYKQKCTVVGADFVTAQVKSDICDRMADGSEYRVTNTKSSDTTTFVKQ